MAVTIKKPAVKNDEIGKALGAQSSVTLVKSQVKKQERAVVDSNALESEDSFEEFYLNAEKNPEAVIIRPTYNPEVLEKLVQENNALGQCISAMEVNIDGTGFEIEGAEEGKKETDEEDTQATGIKDFFNEIYPGQSFITVRRKLRRDQEALGNAYLEILRSLVGDLVFAKHIDAATMRMVKLDEPVLVPVTVNRFGNDHEVMIMKRERRFAQKVGKKLVFFKEFGATRDLNKHTGQWAEQGEVLPAEDRATEIIHFFPIKDATTPYGVPRWINQVPSVLGSRKAEELNLDFFNAGGLPPALITIMGGELTEQVRKQLQTYLSGKGASKHRAAIVEVHSTGGDLNAPGNVKVAVERFGAERQQDSMFENYDDKSERRTRSSFRLPPMFVGRTEDYSFATAFASYTVAEAQVFEPERREFDEIMNNTIMKDVGEGFRFRSLSLNVKDATQQLKGVELAKDSLDKEGLVEAVNEIVNLELQPKEEDSVIEGQSTTQVPALPAPGNTSVPNPAPGGPAASPVSKIDPLSLIELSREWAAFSVKENQGDPVLVQTVKNLSGSDRQLFDAYTAMNLMSGFDYDPEGATELAGAATEIMAGCCNHDHS